MNFIYNILLCLIIFVLNEWYYAFCFIKFVIAMII